MKHVLVSASCLALTLATVNCADKSPAPHATPSSNRNFSGKVVETMNAASYTYVRVDTGKEKLWAAAPQTEVKVGDTVTITDGMPMPNYHSKTLNRDFDVIYFAGSLRGNGTQLPPGHPKTSLPAGHPPLTGGMGAPKIDLTGIQKAKGGKTIQEIFAGKAKLKGKQVTVRGKVVKYNTMIMDRNWLHIQDGTGTVGSNDLTVTTRSEVKLGDTVLVTGTLALDKDFGHGYRYAVIVEDAKVAVE